MGNTMPPDATPRNGVLLAIALVLLSSLPTAVASIEAATTRSIVTLISGLALVVAGYFMTPAKPKPP